MANPYDLARARTPALIDGIRAGLRLDTWINAITGLGGRKDRTQGAAIYGFRRLSTAELDALYHGEDLPAIIVNALPEDAFRQGLELDADLIAGLDRWDALTALRDAWIWGRLYGVGAVMLTFRERLGRPQDPLDSTKIQRGDLVGLTVVDRWDLSIASRNENPLHRDFDKPRTYRINLAGLGSEVHASRMIVFGGAHTSERQRRANDGFDLSVLQRAADVLRDFDQSWKGVMFLLQDLSQAVFKIDGLVQMIAEGQKDAVLERMEVVNMARSIARAVVVDKDGEDFTHVGAANVTGIQPLMDSVFQRLATAAEMPLTRLTGVSPAGLNATGASDITNWNTRVAVGQRKVTPQVRRLCRIIARAEGLDVPETIVWPSLWVPTPTEKAALEKQEADTDAVRITSQVATADECRAVRFQGKDWAEVTAPPELDVFDPDHGEDPPDVPEDYKIETGSLWTDTRDGHRIKVTRVIQALVYAVDLDAPNPGEQFAWTRASFLERCQERAPEGSPPI